jgi:Holliday junction resolvase RusA-like endonuclease
MKLQIILSNIKPISLNNNKGMNFKTKKTFKADNYIQLESLVNNQLRKYKSDINKFNNKYDELKHYIVAEFKHYYPILVKKGDRISKTSKDVFNIPKCTEDIIFKQLVADDSQVIDGRSIKIHSKDIRIEVTLELKDLKHIL